MRVDTFKKTEKKLMIWASVFISVIIAAIGAMYSYITWNNQRQADIAAFTNDINNIYVYIKNTRIIQKSIISQYTDKNYQICIDEWTVRNIFPAKNEIPDSGLICEEVQRIAREQYGFITEIRYQEAYPIRHIEFEYQRAPHDKFFASVARMNNGKNALLVTVLYPLTAPAHSIRRTILLILLITVCGDVILCSAACLAIGKLLKPIRDARLKQNDFVAAASHELKTPLAIILSSISAMKKSDEAEFVHHQSIAREECIRMSGLVEDMLSLTRADHHAMTLSVTKQQPEDIIIDCYNHFETLIYRKGLEFHVHLNEDIPPCNLDRNKIMQLLIILLDNALNYTDHGCITLSCSYRRKTLLLSVADTGCGVSAEEKKHIFDRFYSSNTSHSNRRHHGLGLSIAKEIAEAHSGAVAVSDTPGGGATFTVSLPQKNI